MANFPLPVLASTLYEHDCVRHMKYSFSKCQQEPVAELYLRPKYLLYSNYILFPAKSNSYVTG